MDKPINERWIQFAFINAKGAVNKTALKFPFHTDLAIDQEVPMVIVGKTYEFTCVGEETKTNHGETVDKIYILATIHA
jgi:hypothetical protein